MRSGFGKEAQRLRTQREMTQRAFAEEAGFSLSRVSDIEHQRVAVSDDVLRVYLKVLKPTGDDADKLRKLARFSNDVREAAKRESTNPPLAALFKQFGDRLSPDAQAQIQRIVERETGESVSMLTFASNKIRKCGRARKAKRPQLGLKRFVEICVVASRARARFALETDRLQVGWVLERLSCEDETFNYQIVERMPSNVQGAFACIVGDVCGHTVYLEEDRFISAENGVHFLRHVIAHEIAHHFLHSDDLDGSGEYVFAPQSLGRNSSNMIDTAEQIEQVVDTLEEVEAECFATFFLVPWEAMIKGTRVDYLARDYGEQVREIERYMSFFRQAAVVDEFKSQLWQLGENSHPVFHYHP